MAFEEITNNDCSIEGCTTITYGRCTVYSGEAIACVENNLVIYNNETFDSVIGKLANAICSFVPGNDGADGVGIASIVAGTPVGNVTTYTIIGTDDSVLGTFDVTNGVDGDQGVAGTDGDDGKSIAILYAFKRSATAPATPVDGSFDFSTGVLTPPDTAWSSTVPVGTTPCYVSITTAISATPNGTDSSLTWSTPVIAFQNGINGAVGATGATGATGSTGLTGPAGITITSGSPITVGTYVDETRIDPSTGILYVWSGYIWNSYPLTSTTIIREDYHTDYHNF